MSGFLLVGVVVVNWNQGDNTVACVGSVMASQGVEPVLIVVDNGSTDGSAELIRATFPRAYLLLAHTNRGYAAGANIGMCWALKQGLDYVLLLNNDTVLDPACIKQLAMALQQNPTAGIAGPLILYADEPQRIWYLADREFPLLPVPFSVGRGQIDRGQFSRTIEVDFVSGCAMMVRRVVLERVGLFEEQLFMHYEDADFCERVRRAGFRILAVPTARLWHKVSQSGRQLGSAIAYYQSRNRVWFYASHRYGFARIYALTYVIFSEIIRCGCAWLKGNKDVAWARWQGLRQGLKRRLGEWYEA